MYLLFAAGIFPRTCWTSIFKLKTTHPVDPGLTHGKNGRFFSIQSLEIYGRNYPPIKMMAFTALVVVFHGRDLFCLVAFVPNIHPSLWDSHASPRRKSGWFTQGAFHGRAEFFPFWEAPVEGWGWLLMATRNPARFNQWRLVDYPIVYKVFYTSQVVGNGISSWGNRIDTVPETNSKSLKIGPNPKKGQDRLEKPPIFRLETLVLGRLHHWTLEKWRLKDYVLVIQHSNGKMDPLKMYFLL